MAPNHDIRLPAASILAMRRTLVRQLGVGPAYRALQEAGHAAGDAVFERLGQGQDVSDTPADTFWSQLDDLASEMGLGRIEHQALHPGVGSLTGRDWFEIDPEVRVPSSPFSTGLLSNLLGRAAGGEVAVLQVPCDDEGCVRFLFGSGAVVQKVYDEMRSGADVNASVAALG